MATLRDIVNSLDELDDDAVIYTNGSSPAADAVVVAGADVADAKRAGMKYFLEVSLAKDAVSVWSDWRGGAAPATDDKLEAIAYYATNDAYLPAN